MDHSDLLDYLANGIQECFTDNRRLKTISRICHHQNQFENWVKIELGTFLWELAKRKNLYVFIERNAVDITLGIPTTTGELDTSEPFYPIELKTTGTYWKGAEAETSARLALESDGGKKLLWTDMNFIAQSKAGKLSKFPFGLVVLLITHVESYHTAGKYDLFKKTAIKLGHIANLSLVTNPQGIELQLPKPMRGHVTPNCCLMIWSSK